jgi:CRP/FNR family cyclic AMP-dependent transcriptional regulator
LAGLDSILLFADLPPDTVAAIGAKAVWREFAPDQQVFDKQSDTVDVYFIVSGSVRILRSIAPEREVALADIGPGNFFGELAAIDGGERSARVVTLEPTLLASLDGPAFKEVMAAYPLVTERVMLRLAQVIRTLDNRVSDLSTLTEEQRVMLELIRLTRPDPRHDGGFYIPDLPNHREIAGWAGTNREAVAKTIGELTRMRVVERRSMSLMVRDWPKLHEMAHAGKEST